MDSTTRNDALPYTNIWNTQELNYIKREIFKDHFPEELSKIIFSSTKSSDLKLDEKKWGMKPQDMISRVELTRLSLLFNSIIHQIENIKNRFGEMEYPYVYVVLSGESNLSSMDPQKSKEFLLKQRQVIIENISLLSPTHIKQLKIDFGVALPMGFDVPNLLDIAWHFSWVRRGSGDTIGKKIYAEPQNRFSIIGNSIGKICELGSNDWQLTTTIIEDEKTRNQGLSSAIKYLSNIQLKDKAREVAEIISDVEIRKHALSIIGNT